MADFKPTRRTEAAIREAWEADQLVNAAELAAVVGVARSLVYQWKKQGLPFIGCKTRRPWFEEWAKRKSRPARSRKPHQKPTEPPPAPAPAPAPPVARMADFPATLPNTPLPSQAMALWLLADGIGPSMLDRKRRRGA